MDDHQLSPDFLNSTGEPTPTCAQIEECLYLARFGRLDLLWTDNMLARSVTKWTNACTKRLAQLISHIIHANHDRQNCLSETKIRTANLDFFSDANVAGGLQDSKSIPGEVYRGCAAAPPIRVQICSYSKTCDCRSRRNILRT